MPLDPVLRTAYQAADYAVFGEPELLIRIGEPNADLDGLLEMRGARSAAFVTAANPFGRRRSALRNRIAFAFLRKILLKKRQRFLPGEGRDPEGKWTSEPSVLILAIARAEAVALGRKLEQYAIVWIEKGRAPELVVLI